MYQVLCWASKSLYVCPIYAGCKESYKLKKFTLQFVLVVKHFKNPAY